MEKKTLSSLLEGKIFKIPDYQRGYAWEEEHWKDFVQDIDALIDDNIISHYTGTIVIFQPTSRPTENYGTKKLEIVDVVDGQQRLTTCSLYLSIIIDELVKQNQEEYKAELPIYLYSGSKSRLRLNNDTEDFYFDLISKGATNVKANTVHQVRLLEGYEYLKKHLKEQFFIRKELGLEYLQSLFDAIIRKLNFSFYPIEVESEIGMTFELMNSRGKDLSSLELLKNYLMYWVYRNIPLDNEKENFTNTINKSWKEIYVNIASCKGSENQCLRIAWTLFVSYTPKNWEGYGGFKSDNVIPLRDFTKKSKEDTKRFVLEFTDGLALISKHYSAIIKPNELNNKLEYEILTKIKNAGNIANYLPLMVAVRIKVDKEEISQKDYLNFLNSLEIFSFRVFLWEGKRSNAGLSKFYAWSNDIFSDRQELSTITEWIYGTANWYSNENSFRKKLKEDFYNWYKTRRLLKYTLFEYELWILKKEGKGNIPKLNWNDLSDATLEHILPQNPNVNSDWLKNWDTNNFAKYLHDISNLVLTKDNSHYLNFDFDRKKGSSGVGHCYSNSDIRQERKISEFSEWTVNSCIKRRVELENWIVERWGIEKHFVIPSNLAEDDAEDELLEINLK